MPYGKIYKLPGATQSFIQRECRLYLPALPVTWLKGNVQKVLKLLTVLLHTDTS